MERALTKIQQQYLIEALYYHIKSLFSTKAVYGFGDVLLDSNTCYSENTLLLLKLNDYELTEEGYSLTIKVREFSTDSEEFELTIKADNTLYLFLDRVISKLYIA